MQKLHYLHIAGKVQTDKQTRDQNICYGAKKEFGFIRILLDPRQEQQVVIIRFKKTRRTELSHHVPTCSKSTGSGC